VVKAANERARHPIKASAYRRYDIRRLPSARGRVRGQGSGDARHVRRALATLDGRAGGGHTYAVTDVVTVPGPGRRKTRVVYVQQRYLGLPVYDGRRSAIFAGDRVEWTGRAVPIRSLAHFVPTSTAEQAIVAAHQIVFGEAPRELEEMCSFSARERFAAFRSEGLRHATAHVAVLAERGRGHLVWVVDIAQAAGPRFELLLGAQNLQLMGRRLLSQWAQACITLPSGAQGAKVPFDGAWAQSGAVEVAFDNKKWKPPSANAPNVCGSTTRDTHSLNAFSLGNLALDLFSRLLPTLKSVQLKFDLFSEKVNGEVAAASADRGTVLLRGVSAVPGRFAALDPTVVVHEVSHVALCAAVGGSTLSHPFEAQERSGAVNEGLADFFGLTLWNSLGRAMVVSPGVETAFGSLFLSARREYATYIAGQGAPLGDETGAHRTGRFLCGALLRARSGFLTHGLGEDAADEAIWSALVRGLPSLPHQGGLPDFCCVRKVVSANLAPALHTIAEDAFRAIRIPAPCHHIQGGVQ
jgi:hypothetical protein